MFNIIKSKNPNVRLTFNFILGLLVSVVLMSVFFFTLEIDSLVATLKTVNYWLIIPSVIVGDKAGINIFEDIIF